MGERELTDLLLFTLNIIILLYILHTYITLFISEFMQVMTGNISNRNIANDLKIGNGGLNCLRTIFIISG